MAAVPMRDQVPGIMTKKEHKVVGRRVEQVADHDHALWAGIRGRRRKLPGGCRIFMLNLLSSVMLLSQFAVSRGLKIVHHDHPFHNNVGLMTKEGRDQVDRQIEETNP